MTDANTHSTAKETLKLLIADFRELQHKLVRFEEYDSAMNSLRAKYSEASVKLQDPLRSIAQQLFEISDQAHFLFHIFNRKIYYLAEGLEHALEVENPLTLANNTRCLVEHIATVSTVGQKLAKLDADLAGQQSEDKIKSILGGAQEFLGRAYYGKSPKGASVGQMAALHINDSLRDLKKEVSNVDDIYDFLCEFVHPNYGSNQLVSSGKLASGQLRPSEAFGQDIQDKLRRICSYCFIYLRNEIMGHFASPIRIQARLDLCFVQGAKLTNVFAKMRPVPIGDGQSKDTAYFFPKARTSAEAINLTSEFFKQEGIVKDGPKQIGLLEGKFIYDVFPTNKGMVWVKIAVPEIGLHG